MRKMNLDATNINKFVELKRILSEVFDTKAYINTAFHAYRRTSIAEKPPSQVVNDLANFRKETGDTFEFVNARAFDVLIGAWAGHPKLKDKMEEFRNKKAIMVCRLATTDKLKEMAALFHEIEQLYFADEVAEAKKRGMMGVEATSDQTAERKTRARPDAKPKTAGVPYTLVKAWHQTSINSISESNIDYFDISMHK